MASRTKKLLQDPAEDLESAVVGVDAVALEPAVGLARLLDVSPPRPGHVDEAALLLLRKPLQAGAVIGRVGLDLESSSSRCAGPAWRRRPASSAGSPATAWRGPGGSPRGSSRCPRRWLMPPIISRSGLWRKHVLLHVIVELVPPAAGRAADGGHLFDLCTSDTCGPATDRIATTRCRR